MTGGVGIQVCRRSRATQRGDAVHILNSPQRVEVIEAAGVCPGDDQPWVTRDDRLRAGSEIALAVAFVAHDQQQAVVSFGPLDIAIEILPKPVVRTLSKPGIGGGVGRVGSRLVRPIGVVEIVRNHERHGWEIGISVDGQGEGFEAIESFVHVRVGLAGADRREHSHRIMTARVVIGVRAVTRLLNLRAIGGQTFGVTGKAQSGRGVEGLRQICPGEGVTATVVDDTLIRP